MADNLAYSKEVPSLLTHHLAQLLKSSISLEVIKARGYRSVVDKTELARLGFDEFQQRRTPCILIPLFSTDGRQGPFTYQIKPDNPRMKKKRGEFVKYESLVETCLDIHPISKLNLKNTNIPLWATEGVKKADSLNSRRQCAIALAGVWNFKNKDESGSSVLMADFDYIPVNNRIVYICFDSDYNTNRKVRQAAYRLAEHFRRKGAAVLFIRLPMNGTQKVGVDDYLAAGHTIEDVIALAGENLDASPASVKSSLPKIVCNNRSLADKTNNAFTAVIAKNEPPILFVRDHHIAKPVINELGTPAITELHDTDIRCVLAETGTYVNKTENGEVEISPPMDVVNNMIARITLGQDAFPALRAITETPYIIASGEIIATPGYNPKSQIYFIPNSNLTLPRIPECLSDDDITAAKRLLDEIFCDIPFDSTASRVNTLAALMTPVVRQLIVGPTPLCVIDKFEAGSGATLIAKVIALVATGRAAAMITAPQDPDEWKKTISGALLQGRNVIVIDNVEGNLYNESLASILTATSFSTRMLGSLETRDLPNYATWIVTGNNVSLGGDMPRRAYLCRIDPGVAKPWLRDVSKFKHPELEMWVSDNRGAIVAAILTLAKSWIINGCPIPEDLPRLGGYEGWVRVIGGILSHAGIFGFLGNLMEMYESNDSENPAWAAFVATWYDKFSGEWVTVADLMKAIEEDKDFESTCPIDPPSRNRNTGVVEDGGFTRRLGKALSKRKGRVYEKNNQNFRIQKNEEKHEKRAILWRIFVKNGDFRDGNSPNIEAKSEFGEFSQGPTREEVGKTNQKVYRGYTNSPNSLNEASANVGTKLTKNDIMLIEQKLGITLDRAVEIWTAEGRPVVRLSRCSTTENLEYVLRNGYATDEELANVRVWLESKTGESF